MKTTLSTSTVQYFNLRVRCMTDYELFLWTKLQHKQHSVMTRGSGSEEKFLLHMFHLHLGVTSSRSSDSCPWTRKESHYRRYTSSTCMSLIPRGSLCTKFTDYIIIILYYIDTNSYCFLHSFIWWCRHKLKWLQSRVPRHVTDRNIHLFKEWDVPEAETWTNRDISIVQKAV